MFGVGIGIAGVAEIRAPIFGTVFLFLSGFERPNSCRVVDFFNQKKNVAKLSIICSFILLIKVIDIFLHN